MNCIDGKLVSDISIVIEERIVLRIKESGCDTPGTVRIQHTVQQCLIPVGKYAIEIPGEDEIKETLKCRRRRGTLYWRTPLAGFKDILCRVQTISVYVL
ncbi:hypothetical protein KQX54_007483 [Cotesia glomerata]|uniref:Uncharacterized protein n=1 Tax=Cotesia glomerata TaxID=32391 RepID=A0AAV7J855_COTGL|nr:hypothetical protein KQX54_007483 [Cotesia glomerata]